MKRDFGDFVKDLNDEDRKKVPRSREDVYGGEVDSYAADIYRTSTSTDIDKEKEREKQEMDSEHCTASMTRLDHPSEQEEGIIYQTTLDKIGQAILFTNKKLLGSTSAAEATQCSGVDSSDDDALLAPGHASSSSPSCARLDKREAAASGGDARDLGSRSSAAEADVGGGKIDEGVGSEIDWDGVPIARAVCCVGAPRTVWTEEMEREMREAALMPLPDDDDEVEVEAEVEDEEDIDIGTWTGTKTKTKIAAHGGKDGIKWVFKRTGQGI